MNSSANESVLIICDDENCAVTILSGIESEGFKVVGVATSAAIALMLAAQVAPTIAVVARPPTGRRNATRLAHELMTNWGVRSLILTEAHDAEEPFEGPASWSPRPDQMVKLRRAVAGGGSVSDLVH